MTDYYDFILFENYHQAQNHKFDMLLTAKMLQSQGQKVAILDVYGEDNTDDMEGIHVIHLSFRSSIPNDKWQMAPKNKLHSLFALIRFYWQQHWYMKRVIEEIKPLASHFYFGSYHTNLPLSLLSIKEPCYFWGLRSERMRDINRYLKRNFVEGIHMWFLKRQFMKNPYQRLFVSNHIIMDEHEKLGLPKNRMVIREERCVYQKTFPQYEKLNFRFTFLTIGQLRSDKRIDYTLSEFSELELDCQYILAGKSQGQYEKIIENSMKDNINVVRINKFLDYSDFNDLFAKAQFVVFADKPQNGCVTNGTMAEAFINHRPIIAPDYNPYKYYIEKYGVGILYNPEVKGELSKAMHKAVSQGCRYYEKNIESFLNNIMFDKVAEKLLKDLKDIDNGYKAR